MTAPITDADLARLPCVACGGAGLVTCTFGCACECHYQPLPPIGRDPNVTNEQVRDAMNTPDALARSFMQIDDYRELNQERNSLEARLAAMTARAEKATRDIYEARRQSLAHEEYAVEKLATLKREHSEEMHALREWHREQTDSSTRAYGVAMAAFEAARADVERLRASPVYAAGLHALQYWVDADCALCHSSEGENGNWHEEWCPLAPLNTATTDQVNALLAETAPKGAR